MSKSRKSLTPSWSTCPKCGYYVAAKDCAIHNENCPPIKPFKHSFIHDGIFYSTLETYTAGKYLSKTYFSKGTIQNNLNYRSTQTYYPKRSR